MGEHRIRELTPADLPAMRRVLGRAFADDPVMEHVFRGRPDIERRAGRLYGLFCRLHMHHGRCLTTEDAEGAALWVAPGRWRVGPRQQIGMLPGLLSTIGLRAVRLMGDFDAMERHHASVPQDHWYLSVLGTEPDHQGKGIGAALVQPVLDHCDAEGLGAYLESSKETNIGYYRRFGFEVVGELRFRGGPPMWPMWRDPR